MRRPVARLSQFALRSRHALVLSLLVQVIFLASASAHEGTGRAGFREPLDVEIESEFYVGRRQFPRRPGGHYPPEREAKDRDRWSFRSRRNGRRNLPITRSGIRAGLRQRFRPRSVFVRLFPRRNAACLGGGFARFPSLCVQRSSYHRSFLRPHFRAGPGHRRSNGRAGHDRSLDASGPDWPSTPSGSSSRSLPATPSSAGIQSVWKPTWTSKR